MDEAMNYKTVLLDIEGTTTPVSFVYEVLFPYAQQKVKNYVEQHWNDPELQRDVDVLVEQAAALSEAADESVGELPEDRSDVDTFRSAVVQYIHWQMDRDKKTTPLKAIQGRIWRSGYEQGELKAPLFDDVEAAFEQWRERDVPIHIYSSGSVEAQKLLFSHTTQGDLTDFIDGYYDTTTGSKKARHSYELIADDIGEEPHDILFVTDNLDEAEAAREAGCQVAVSSRPGNSEQPKHDFPEITSFEALQSG